MGITKEILLYEWFGLEKVILSQALYLCLNTIFWGGSSLPNGPIYLGPFVALFYKLLFWTNSRLTKELNREHIFSLAFYQLSSDISIAYNQRIKTRN